MIFEPVESKNINTVPYNSSQQLKKSSSKQRGIKRKFIINLHISYTQGC